MDLQSKGSKRVLPREVNLEEEPCQGAEPVCSCPPSIPTKGPRARALCMSGQATGSCSTSRQDRSHSTSASSGKSGNWELLPLQEANLGGVPKPYEPVARESSKSRPDQQGAMSGASVKRDRGELWLGPLPAAICPICHNMRDPTTGVLTAGCIAQAAHHTKGTVCADCEPLVRASSQMHARQPW